MTDDAFRTVFWSEAGRRLVHSRYESLLERWPTPYERLRFPTCQGETFVLVAGRREAPPLVLLHGGMTTSAMWSRNAPAWSQHFRVYAVDLIGEPGYSAPRRPPLASDAHARWLDDVWSALGIDSAFVVGASFGGWVALDYATRRPSRVAGLVLLAPGGVGRVRLGFLFKVAPLLLLGHWGHRRAMSFDMGFDPSEAASPEGRVFVDFLELTGQHYVMRTKPIPTFTDRTLRALTMPVLAVLGGEDAVFDSEHTQERLQRCVPHARVDYLPGAGHSLVDPTSRVLDFLLPLHVVLRASA